MRLKIAARQSALARLQAYAVGDAILSKHANIEIDYRFRESLGDQNQHDPLWKMPEKGVFTEDFKRDLLNGDADLVVHSWKDLPTANSGDTEIVATLPRADRRDLLLLKKSSLLAPSVVIFSSSPRRAWNLKAVLPELLPGRVESIRFVDVRGNVPTRVRKLLEDPHVDGLIVAKAALDRLLSSQKPEFQEPQQFLRSALERLKWMALPLSLNPTAAAQGALAVEIRVDRSDLRSVLQQINCSTSFEEAERERGLLKEFGGGCHLALGMSHLRRANYSCTFVRGKTPNGAEVSTMEFAPIGKGAGRPKISPHLCWSSAGLKKTRRDLKIELKPNHGYVVSRFESWPIHTIPEDIHIWTAGVETWKKLARKGLWVLGSFDSLGSDSEFKEGETLLPGVEWSTLTHSRHPQWDSKRHLASYEIEVDGSVPSDVQYCFWRSASDFLFGLAQRPDLQMVHHACGPGSTFEFLKTRVSEDKLHVFLNEEEWRKSL